MCARGTKTFAGRAYSWRVATELSWKRNLALTLAVPTLAAGYFAWRGNGRFLHSPRFWVIVAIVFVPDIAAILASVHLSKSGRPRAAAAIGFAGRFWLAACVCWFVLQPHLSR